MLLENLSPLANNLIIISLVGITAFIMVQIIRFSMLKSIEAATGSKDEDREKRERQVGFAAKTFTYIVLAATIITLLVFLIFMRSSDSSGPVKITAPVPAEFKSPGEQEIEEVNKTSTQEKPEELKKEASDDNTEAMNEAIDLFKKTK